MELPVTPNRSNSTRVAYLATRVLDTPLWAIYNMLPFILQKDLQATPFQIAVVIALKPIVAVLSMYWSSLVNERPDRLRSNIILARFLGCLPFFCFPFFHNPWFFIASSGIYMMLAVGVVPAWMEILKANLSDDGRKQTFAWGSAMGYLGGGLLPIVFGWILDDFSAAWQWIFPAAGVISMLAAFYQFKMPAPEPNVKTAVSESINLKKIIVDPWMRSYKLLKERRDFAHYQAAFMAMGTGLMLMQPALYGFFDEKLGLSFLEFAVALSFCKGISYAIASPLWGKLMNRVGIFKFSSIVTALAAFFPILLIAAMWHIGWLYIGYILYGIMQAGSEMSWNMSGPTFANHKDSSLFTGVNVVTVGLRGMFAPALGGLLYSMTGSSTFVMGLSCLCFIYSTKLFLSYRAEKPIPASIN